METKLGKWIIINSNGDWEHEYGVKITSTDNPGWQIEIDLKNTALESAKFEYEKRIENEIINVKIENSIFKGFCSLTMLDKCCSLFFDQVIPEQSDKNFEYEVFEPCHYENKVFWRPVYGTLTRDLKIEITRIPELIIENLKAETIEILTRTVFSGMKDLSLAQIGKEYDVTLKKLNDGSFPVLKIL